MPHPAPIPPTPFSPDVVLQVGVEQVTLSDDEARLLVTGLLQSSEAEAAHRLAGTLCRARATRSETPVVAPASSLDALAEVVGAEGATPTLRRLQAAARSE
jgi:hypothetical protein